MSSKWYRYTCTGKQDMKAKEMPYPSAKVTGMKIVLYASYDAGSKLPLASIILETL
jgi:hypothetical protein